MIPDEAPDPSRVCVPLYVILLFLCLSSYVLATLPLGSLQRIRLCVSSDDCVDDTAVKVLRWLGLSASSRLNSDLFPLLAVTTHHGD